MEYPALQKIHVKILRNNTKLSSSKKEIKKLPATVYKVESRNAASKQKEQSLRHFAHSVEIAPPTS